MELRLHEKPKGPIIIEGFPGLGFVGTIASEYLIEKLDTKPIGQLWSPKIPPVAMIHGSEVRRLLEIRYAKKENIIILHAVALVKDLEWDLSETIIELARKVKAKEIISLEGVGIPMGDASQESLHNPEVAYFYSSDKTKTKKLKSAGALPLVSGSIMGVSGALITQAPKDIPTTFIFGATHTNLPDSSAAANIIKILDKYLGLKVDYKPLIKESEKFESQLKGMVRKTEEAKKVKEKKEISYLG